MADFGDFLSGFVGSLAAQRQQQRDLETEGKEWERRQRLLNDLDVDKTRRINALEKKDGNTYKNESGEWITEVLDGGGNVTGTRPATPSEIASVEAATLGVDMAKDEFAYRPREREMREEEHQSNIDYKRQMLALQRRGQDLAAAGAATAAPGVEAVVDDWLASEAGELAAKAYSQTMGRGLTDGALRGGRFDQWSSMKEEEQLYAGQQRLREAIIEQLAAMSPEERPKTESQLKALIARIAATSRGSLDRYTTPPEK